MKVLLICVGSRGDAEPMIALADRLVQREGNSVEFFIQSDLEMLVTTTPNNKPSSQLTIHPMPFTQFDFYKYLANPSKGVNLQGRARFVAVVADVIGELVLPNWKPIFDVAKFCNVFVATALARSVCFAISSKLNIPTVLIHLQPLVATKLFPHYSDTDDCINTLLYLDDDTSKSDHGPSPTNEAKNLESYWTLERYQHEFSEERLDKMYNEMELMPRIDFETTRTILSGNDDRIFVGNAFYNELIPHVTDTGPNVHHIGSLADHYIPSDFEPPSDLVDFLCKNPKPVCVGFGSMPYDQVSLVLDVLQQVDRKAVLVGKTLELASSENDWAKTNAIQVSSIPYAWLLPQCQMMLCHGGAGVVHTTLRAGIPVVISPFMGDQFFFAELIKAKGLGSRASSMLPQATKEDFVLAIQVATDCIDTAKAFGANIRSQLLGVDNLIKLLNTIVE